MHKITITDRQRRDLNALLKWLDAEKYRLDGSIALMDDDDITDAIAYWLGLTDGPNGSLAASPKRFAQLNKLLLWLETEAPYMSADLIGLDDKQVKAALAEWNKTVAHVLA